jgi:pimeloyl-ACP methyl ester carboxylesterase
MRRGARIWKVTWHVLAILAGLVVLFFVAVVPWFFTSIITTHRYHFPDPNDGKSPKSYGMDFQGIQFHSPDGIRLDGWYVPAGPNARGTIIYCHGQNRSKVEMLPMAAFGHERGFNGLLFDFRHQGESGGEISTIGYQERLDVIAAVRYALDQEKAARPIVLWGVSMGASAALMAAAETPEVNAVISDSSFLSFTHVITHHWKLFFHLPPFPVAYEIIYWSAWRGGFWPSDFDLEKAVRRIGLRPILYVAVEGDRRMPPSIARTLYTDDPSPLKQIAIVPGRRHGEGFKSGNQPYEEAVRDFLAKVAAESPERSGAKAAGGQAIPNSPKAAQH